MKQRLFLAFSIGMLMVLTVSLRAEETQIGKPAPEFSLTDVQGKKRSLSDYRGKYVVLEWVNHGCPFVKKHYNSGNMQATQKDAKARGAVWLSICSSARGKQGYYSPEEWLGLIKEKKSESDAVLPDAEGSVGRLYGAKTTPHMFVVDPKGILIYKGAIDDKPSTDAEDIPGAKNYVRAALEEAMAKRKISVQATPSYGCSVKYK